MELGLLRTFVAAARLGSLRRAAEELFLSPPAVTVQLRRLEREVGCQLFERASTGVRLTPAGWWLLPRAQAALGQLDAAREGLLAFGEGPERRVGLAASPFVARTALPSVLAGLRAERPDLDYAVDVMQSADIAAVVAAGRADLGLSLLPGPPAAPRRGTAAAGAVSAERLWTEPVVLVAPGPGGGRPGREDAPADWRALVRAQRLLVGSHPAFWDDLLATLRRLGALGRTMPVTDMDITRRFIGEGLGVSFLPASAVAADLGSGRLAAVPTPGLEAPSSEVYAVRAAPPRRGAGLAEGPASPEGVEALLAALRGDRGPG